MSTTVKTGAAAPSLIARAAAALFGDAAEDPAALRKKADELRADQAKIEKVRHRERRAVIEGKTEERWEDGNEAGNRIDDLKREAGQLESKAAKIEAEARWKHGRESALASIKAKMHEAGVIVEARATAMTSATGKHAKCRSELAKLKALQPSLSQRLTAAKALQDEAMARNADALVSAELSEGTAPKPEPVSGLMANVATLDLAVIQTAQRIKTMTTEEDTAHREAESAAYGYWLKFEELQALKIEAIGIEERELFETWAAARMLCGLGVPAHRHIEIDIKAAEARAAMLRQEFGQ